MLLSMLQDQNTPWIKDISYQTLPKIGYISILGNHPIAAGFLRKVEGGYGQLDTFVTNPYFGSQIRHLAIERIVDSLLLEAEVEDMKGIIAISEDQGIIDRAKEKGFFVIPQTILGFRR